MESFNKLSRPIIVDTDLSFDDYVALLYLLQHPAIDVKAITVVNGVVHVKPGIENARRLLALVGKLDIPVAGGPDKPLTGQRTFPGLWRTLMDYAPRPWLPGVSANQHGVPAPELIRQQCMDSDKPVTFVALGPLTNLALALKACPSLAERIKMIYISGGAINVPGTIHTDKPSNPNRVAEWNHYLDPEAADLVYKAGIPIILIPLDVTHVTGPRPLLFTQDFVRSLRTSARGRASRFMVHLIHWWQLSVPRYPATPVWDAVTAAIVADFATGSIWQDMSIRIVTQTDEVAGQTKVEIDGPKNAQVCMEGNQILFETAFMAIASG